MRRTGLDKAPRDLTQSEFQASMSDADLRRSIRVGKGQMPAFGAILPPAELDNVIAYVRTLDPDHAARVAAARAAAGAGGASTTLPAGSAGKSTEARAPGDGKPVVDAPGGDAKAAGAKASDAKTVAPARPREAPEAG